MARPLRDVLFVEGVNDQHTLWNLLEIYQIPERFEVQSCKNDDGLLKAFRGNLRAENETVRIGMIIDADTDVMNRWQAAKSILDEVGYGDIPTTPPSEGGVFTAAGKSRAGVWIMPNNALPGMLEDFALSLIPEGDPLLAHARSAVAAVPDSPQRFIEAHRSKAELHTYLAWQNEPGKPIGQSLRARHLDAMALPAQELIGWIRNLFELPIEGEGL